MLGRSPLCLLTISCWTAKPSSSTTAACPTWRASAPASLVAAGSVSYASPSTSSTLDGFDMRPAPLVERKRLLDALLAGSSEALRLSEHLGLEGIISEV